MITLKFTGILTLTGDTNMNIKVTFYLETLPEITKQL